MASTSTRFLATVSVIAETIGCSSAEYLGIYLDTAAYSNESVVEKAFKAVLVSGTELKVENEDYRLADLLNHMLIEAPDQESGKRFVAVAIILAEQNKKLVDLAKKWLEHFVLELLTLSAERELDPKDEPAIAPQLEIRDGDRCRITGCIDLFRAPEAGEVEKDLLDGLLVEYFIPLPPTTLTNKLQASLTLLNFAYDTLWVWANLTEDDWSSKLYSAENAFLLASRHVIDVRRMSLVLEEKDTPNTYTASLTSDIKSSPTGKQSREVVFSPAHNYCTVPLPDRRLIKTFSALAKLVAGSNAMSLLRSIVRKELGMDSSSSSSSSEEESEESDAEQDEGSEY